MQVQKSAFENQNPKMYYLFTWADHKKTISKSNTYQMCTKNCYYQRYCNDPQQIFVSKTLGIITGLGYPCIQNILNKKETK